MKTTLTIIFSLLLLSPMACDDSSNSNNNPKTNEEFLTLLQTEYVDGYCSYLDRCPQADGEEWMTSEASCRAVMGEFLLAEGLMEMKWALENGAEYNVDNLNACMNSLGGAGCDTNLDSVAACDQVLQGTLAADAECSSDFQCASGYCNTSETCPGVCEATLAAGSPCDSDSQCNFGLVCDFDVDPSVCATPAAKADQGEACEYDDQCKYGLFCLITDFETYVGACEPWLALGDLCNGDGNMGMVCEPGLACSSTSGECENQTVVGVGETCDNETLVCDFSQRAICMEGDVTGTCLALPGDGEACLMENCWAGNYCGADTICHTMGDIGDACTEDNQCLSNWCDVTTCGYAPCEAANTGK